MAGKIGKFYAWILGAVALAGLVAAFVLHGSTQAGNGDSGTRRKAIAAQVGNDTPVTEATAKREIAEEDAMVQQSLKQQASQAVSRDTAWPAMQLPYQTGHVGKHELQLYQQAKESLEDQVRSSGTHESDPVVLPQPYDALESEQNDTTTLTEPGSRPPRAGAETTAQGRATEADPTAASDAVTPATLPEVSADSANTDQLSSVDPNLKMMARLVGAQTRALTDPNTEWQNNQAKTYAQVPVDPLAVTPAVRKYLLQEGSVIPLVLMTALNNTLPGHVSARVTQDVYDSVEGNRLVIPAGSRMEGNYDQQTRFGQKRMMFAFHRIILPDGSSIRLAAWGGSDKTGRSGVEGELNNHLLEQFGTGILLATIAWALTPSTGSGNVIVNTQGSNGSLATPAGEVVYQTAQNVLSNYQNLKPELDVPAGTRLAVIVQRDIGVEISQEEPQ